MNLKIAKWEFWKFCRVQNLPGGDETAKIAHETAKNRHLADSDFVKLFQIPN